MDYVALTENRVLQNPAVDLYIYVTYVPILFSDRPIRGIFGSKK